MRNKIISILTGLFFFGAFAAFTLLVKTEIFNQIDFNTTVRIQNHIPEKVDSFFSFLSLVGSFEILAGILLIFFIFRKKFFSLLVFIPFGAAHLVEVVGKSFLYHPGPPHMFFRYNMGFLFPSSYVQPGSSYPSGHSLRIIFVSVIFFYLVFKSKINIKTKIFINIIIASFDIAMLVSRVSLGEHWTTDVIGGTLLGLSSGIFSLIFL